MNSEGIEKEVIENADVAESENVVEIQDIVKDGEIDISSVPKLSELEPIVIKGDDGQEKYRLWFSRKTVVELENEGYNPIIELAQKPLYGVIHLFQLAFRTNHKSIGWDEANEIFDKLSVEREALQKKLLLLYFAAIKTLSEDTRKNAGWTVTL